MDLANYKLICQLFRERLLNGFVAILLVILAWLKKDLFSQGQNSFDVTIQVMAVKIKTIYLRSLYQLDLIKKYCVND